MNNYGIVINNENKIYDLIQQGYSAYRISKILGCAKTSVLKFLHDKNWRTAHKSKSNKNNLLKDKTEQVIQLFKEGNSANKIAEIVGHSGNNVCSLLHKNGIKTPRNIYRINESFFDIIDTQEKAYVLGWFYSDGCVNKAGKMRIQIQREDEEILVKIANIMDYDGPIRQISSPKKFPNRKAQSLLNIDRKSLADKLIKLGCIPNKSLIIKFPSENIIPNNLISHFIRGVFDGDGSITKNYCSITSTDIFNKKLQEILKLKLNIEVKYYYRYEKTNTCSLFINKRADRLKFLSWLYADATIFLKRKHDKYLELLAYNTIDNSTFCGENICQTLH